LPNQSITPVLPGANETSSSSPRLTHMRYKKGTAFRFGSSQVRITHWAENISFRRPWRHSTVFVLDMQHMHRSFCLQYPPTKQLSALGTLEWAHNNFQIEEIKVLQQRSSMVSWNAKDAILEKVRGSFCFGVLRQQSFDLSSCFWSQEPWMVGMVVRITCRAYSWLHLRWVESRRTNKANWSNCNG